MSTPAEPPPIRWRPRLTLRVRFVLLTVLAVAFIGGVHRLYLDNRLLNALEEELELRALSFARHLFAESVDLVMDQDLVGLQLSDTMAGRGVGCGASPASRRLASC